MKILIALVTLALTFPAGAQSLHETMKAMSMRLKVIGMLSANPDKNAESAKLAAELAELTASSAKITPDSVTALPEPQRADALAVYKKMLEETAEVARELAKAFSANDNARAMELLKKLKAHKSEGHERFK